MPAAKKQNEKQAAKRPVELIALEVARGKFGRKAGEKFEATKETAEILIKKKFAKKA